MKYIIITLLAVCSILNVSAQSAPVQDSTLQQYVGKYKFAEGNPVTEINVRIDYGILNAVSAMGTSELKKTDKPDVFEVVVYGGTATFKKNADGKVIGVYIVVGDVNMDGERIDGKTAYFFRNKSITAK